MTEGQDLSRIQIGGPKLFFKSEKWGLGLSSRLKKWGLGLFLRSKKVGQELFWTGEIGGLVLFSGLKKWGQELFWTGKIGGLVVFFDREFPQNPAWVPCKFWTVR